MESLGSLFDILGTQVQEENISRYLLEIFLEIVNVIGEMLKFDCMNLFEEIILDNQRAEEIMRLFSQVLETHLKGFTLSEIDEIYQDNKHDEFNLKLKLVKELLEEYHEMKS